MYSESASLAFLPAVELGRLLRAGKIGALELLDYFIERVERFDARINAIVVKDFDRAREAARRADSIRARSADRSKLPPLLGVPLTIKESFDVAGLPTTWGLPELREHEATEDASVVERLRQAGAIIAGKTNVPALLADYQTYNAIYGTTNNPWCLDRTPGGSSGGSAAALAAGLTGLEFGSDIAGSLRNPAHYCGIYSHKPTYGLIPTRGHTIYRATAPADILAVGPLARSARDLELALSVTAGPDEPHATAWTLALPPARQHALRDFRVAVVTSDPTADVDGSVQEQLLKLSDFLAKEGATVGTNVRPAIDFDEVHRLFVLLLRAATSWLQPDDRFSAYMRIAEEVSREDQSYRALMARGNTLLHRDWLRLHEARCRLGVAWTNFFREWDVLLCPAAATAAPRHMQVGERWERMVSVNGHDQPSTTQMFWAGWTGIAGLPSTVAPLGLTKDDQLPVGVQIVGPHYSDLSCIAFARFLEQQYHRFTPPPGYE